MAAAAASAPKVVLLAGAGAPPGNAEKGGWAQVLGPPSGGQAIGAPPGAWTALEWDAETFTSSGGSWIKPSPQGLRAATACACRIEAQVFVVADQPVDDLLAGLAVDGVPLGPVQTISPMTEYGGDTDEYAGGCSLRQIVRLKAGQVVSVRLSPQGGTSQQVPAASCVLIVQRLDR